MLKRVGFRADVDLVSNSGEDGRLESTSKDAKSQNSYRCVISSRFSVTMTITTQGHNVSVCICLLFILFKKLKVSNLGLHKYSPPGFCESNHIQFNWLMISVWMEDPRICWKTYRNEELYKECRAFQTNFGQSSGEVSVTGCCKTLYILLGMNQRSKQEFCSLKWRSWSQDNDRMDTLQMWDIRWWTV